MLECTVYGVPHEWNYFLWVLDTLSNYALLTENVDLMDKIVNIFTNFFT